MISSSSNYLTFKEFIERAIAFELDSVRFYHNLRGRVDNEQVIELLRMLEKEEAKHAASLRGLNMEDKAGLLQFPPELSLSMPDVGTTERLSTAELIEIAIEREEISSKAYMGAAELLRGDMQNLLKGLAHFEDEHREKLVKYKSYFINGE